MISATDMPPVFSNSEIRAALKSAHGLPPRSSPAGLRLKKVIRKAVPKSRSSGSGIEASCSTALIRGSPVPRFSTTQPGASPGRPQGVLPNS